MRYLVATIFFLIPSSSFAAACIADGITYNQYVNHFNHLKSNYCSSDTFPHQFCVVPCSDCPDGASVASISDLICVADSPSNPSNLTPWSGGYDNSTGGGTGGSGGSGGFVPRPAEYFYIPNNEYDSENPETFYNRISDNLDGIYDYNKRYLNAINSNARANNNMLSEMYVSYSGLLSASHNASTLAAAIRQTQIQANQDFNDKFNEVLSNQDKIISDISDIDLDFDDDFFSVLDAVDSAEWAFRAGWGEVSSDINVLSSDLSLAHSAINQLMGTTEHRHNQFSADLENLHSLIVNQVVNSGFGDLERASLDMLASVTASKLLGFEEVCTSFDFMTGECQMSLPIHPNDLDSLSSSDLSAIENMINSAVASIGESGGGDSGGGEGSSFDFTEFTQWAEHGSGGDAFDGLDTTEGATSFADSLAESLGLNEYSVDDLYSEEIDLSQFANQFDSNFIQAPSQCPEYLSLDFTILGNNHSFQLNFAPMCTILELISYILMFVSYVVSAYIILGVKR